ncbi:MAG: S-layer homology domain-containing protein [Oscillospiraceae bacterium]|nr:S-layer homology domain-containing protein [Oscillospiraceae bacterium]
MSKRILSILLTLGILLSLCTTFVSADSPATRGEVLAMLLEAADFYNPDVKASDVMHGDAGGLRENDPVTRAEALVMLSRAFGELPELSGNNLRTAIPMDNFTDIPQWAEAELSPVFEAGLVAGTSSGIFSPSQNVTKEQMELFIDRVFALYGTNYEDDFYATVNKEILDYIELPPGYSDYGVLGEMGIMSAIQVYELILQTANSHSTRGSARDHIKTFYNNIVDVDSRNAAGYTPIKDMLKAIDEAKSLSDFEKIITPDNTSLLVYVFADFWPTVDLKDSEVYVDSFQFWTPDLDKKVYEGQADYIKDAHKKKISTYLTLTGMSEEEAKKAADIYFDFEKKISDASLPTEKASDPNLIYNVYTLPEIAAQFKGIDINKIYEQRGCFDGKKIIVSDVGAMKKASELLSDENFEALKIVAKIKLISSVSGYLSEDFTNADMAYDTVVFGVEQVTTPEDVALNEISTLLYSYIDKLYADTYCSDEIVADVTDMVKDIIAEYRSEIQKCDWMSETTKVQALKKLDTMKLFIGAPENYEDFLKGITLKRKSEGGSYFENAFTIYKANRAYAEELSKKLVDKDSWLCPSYEVNAFYSPIQNAITFPIAILQSPVYDKEASREENLGGIGMIIAHEISHAFDDTGAKYDENGNVRDWWTESDYKNFEERCEKAVDFFRGLEPAPGIQVNAELTLGENIADISALHCITAIGEKTKDFDFKAMYESYAFLWLSINTREYLKLQAISDTHSANKLRVNRVLQCVDKFYEVYNIDESDGMFEPKEERVKIW